MNKNFIYLLLFLFCSHSAFAEKDMSDDDIQNFEVELKKTNNVNAKNTTDENNDEKEDKADAQDISAQKFQFSDLGKLAPFKHVSVIQKRFMPKTNRFQLFGGGGIVTNDPFFNTIGLMLKSSYYLSETWGIELNYFLLSTGEKQSTQELRGIQGVKAESLVYPNAFYGLDITYVPIYGKYSYFDEKIIPFDLYFSLGYGYTKVNSGDNEGTIHAATGQIFSLSKRFAFRWDFSWNFYSSVGLDHQTSTINNLFLTVGMSMFFPEGDYR